MHRFPFLRIGEKPTPTGYSIEESKAVKSPSYEGETSFSVVIIGGGLTGLSAALHLIERGANVALLEAAEIGAGASGRSFGQIIPYLRHDANVTRRLLGEAAADRLINLASTAPAYLYGLVKKYSIDCNLKANGSLMAATSSSKLEVLVRRAEFWRKRGVELPILDQQSARAEIGGGNYSGAIVEPRGGSVNPLLLCRGLATVCEKLGVSIYEYSPVVQIEKQAGRWKLQTKKGNLYARQVILCSDTYTGKLWPDLSSRMVYVRGYQIVSEPINGDAWERILPSGRALTDTSPLPSGIRKLESKRLHMSGGVTAATISEARLFASASRRLNKIFPFVRDVQWDCAWSCWIGLLADQFPRLIEAAPGLLIGAGYSGRGMALSIVMGRELARRSNESSSKDEPFPSQWPVSHMPTKLASIATNMALEAYSIVDGLENAMHKYRFQG